MDRKYKKSNKALLYVNRVIDYVRKKEYYKDIVIGLDFDVDKYSDYKFLSGACTGKCVTEIIGCKKIEGLNKAVYECIINVPCILKFEYCDKVKTEPTILEIYDEETFECLQDSHVQPYIEASINLAMVVGKLISPCELKADISISQQLSLVVPSYMEIDVDREFRLECKGDDEED